MTVPVVAAGDSCGAALAEAAKATKAARLRPNMMGTNVDYRVQSLENDAKRKRIARSFAELLLVDKCTS